MLDRTDLPGSCPVPAHLTTLGVSPRPATPLLRTPQCEARLEVLDDGRLRSHETWAWESRPGTGESVVEEVTGRT
ncbi:hypothetical protein Ae706Ps2_3594c [Pseudonocardia sp. Ae706_Ps2]|nr:hypothetical protein Ae706Ps2_3594c [Pseudonocardia sp. Ae706_Ps2]